MRIKKNENKDVAITLNLDKKSYKYLLETIKLMGKDAENKSDTEKLDYTLLVNGQKRPYMKVKGWCSRCVDSNGRVTEVFFCDYDNILYRIVEDEIRYLMEEYDMPPFYVFTTSETIDKNGEAYGNYLVVCLKKQTYREVIKMQNELHCDQAYKQIPLIYRFRTWVLRLSSKGNKGIPKFKVIVGDTNKSYNQEVSKAHLEALESIYKGIPKIKYTNLDGNDISRLSMTEYVTAST